MIARTPVSLGRGPRSRASNFGSPRGPGSLGESSTGDIIYEDLNYRRPFVGKAEVERMVTQYDLGGIEWLLTKHTTGSKACCFTWKIKIKGKDAADGISFYDNNPLTYVRDIPSPLLKPPPLLSLAAKVRPRLRVFRGHRSHWCYGDDELGRPIGQDCCHL